MTARTASSPVPSPVSSPVPAEMAAVTPPLAGGPSSGQGPVFRPPPGLVDPATQPLADAAVNALTAAAQAQSPDSGVVDERAVFRPDTWLLQCCWQNLADAGEFVQALRVARLAAPRQPLAPIHCLHRLSKQIDQHWGLANAVAAELAGMAPVLFGPPSGAASGVEAERLLNAAATAANIGERQLAFACLERLDQLLKPWDSILAHPDQRGMLAATILPRRTTPAYTRFADQCPAPLWRCRRPLRAGRHCRCRRTAAARSHAFRRPHGLNTGQFSFDGQNGAFVGGGR